MIAVLRIFDGHNDVLTSLRAAGVRQRPRGRPPRPAARATAAGLGGGIFAVFVDVAAAIEDIEFDAGRLRRRRCRRRSRTRTRSPRRPRTPGGCSCSRRWARCASCARPPTSTSRDDRLVAVLHLEGAEAIAPRPARTSRLVRGRPALARAGVEPAERFGHGVPFRFPSVARHRARADAGRARARPALQRARHRRRPQPPQRAGLLGRRAHLEGAARRLALGRARAVRRARATSPTSSSTRSAATGGVVGVVFAVAVPARGRRRRRATRRSTTDRRPRALRRRPDRRRPRRAGLGLRRRARSRDELGDVTGLPRLLDALRRRRLHRTRRSRASPGGTGVGSSGHPGAA